MGLNIFWLQFSEDKLKDIHSYYRLKAGKRTAKKMILGIINTTIDLDKNPLIGQKEELLSHRKEEFRYLIFKHYKIIYWVNNRLNRIEIANIFDTRQEPLKITSTK